MSISTVLGQYKRALRGVKNDAGKFEESYTYKSYWMGQFRKAYYEQYSQEKYKNNLVNQTFGWMALIAIVAIVLISTILPLVAMPGIVMLGVGLAITAAALVGMALLGRVRWNAFCEMSKLQKAPKEIKDDDLRQVIKLYDYMEKHEIKTDHHFQAEASKICGIKMVEMKPKGRRQFADDFNHEVNDGDNENASKNQKKHVWGDSKARSMASTLLDRPGGGRGYH